MGGLATTSSVGASSSMADALKGVFLLMKARPMAFMCVQHRRMLLWLARHMPRGAGGMLVVGCRVSVVRSKGALVGCLCGGQGELMHCNESGRECFSKLSVGGSNNRWFQLVWVQEVNVFKG